MCKMEVEMDLVGLDMLEMNDRWLYNWWLIDGSWMCKMDVQNGCAKWMFLDDISIAIYGI